MQRINNVLSEAAEHGLDIVFLYDETGKIIWANKQMETAAGYDVAALDDIKLDELLPGIFDISEGSVKYKVEAVNEVIQTSLYRCNHTCFPVRLLIRKSKEEELYYCFAADISLLEETRKQLAWTKQEAKEAMKERNEFVANITHELRTPVSGILGHTRNALDEECSAPVAGTLRIIERCCGDMNKIIDNILDFSKLEAGKFVLEEREFDFKDFINHVIETHIARINEKGLKFVFSMDDNVPDTIIGDSYHIACIVNNLISNAIKFTSVGKITLQIVKTSQIGNSVELFFIVTDTGIGINDEDKDKLFKSFTQVDASISRQFGGTGLGLAVSKQIVEMMHGSINVESRKGHGSMFSFSVNVKIPESEIVSNPEDNVRTIASIKELIRQGTYQTDKEQDSKQDFKAVRGLLEKIVLCVEMESWEKAELFVDNLKQMLGDISTDTRRAVLKLEMAVRKEEYDKVISAGDNLTKMLDDMEAANDK